jgi:hypothetical protein
VGDGGLDAQRRRVELLQALVVALFWGRFGAFLWGGVFSFGGMAGLTPRAAGLSCFRRWLFGLFKGQYVHLLWRAEGVGVRGLYGAVDRFLKVLHRPKLHPRASLGLALFGAQSRTPVRHSQPQSTPVRTRSPPPTCSVAICIWSTPKSAPQSPQP